MSTKKDRLEAKRREQAAVKAARQEEKKQVDLTIPDQVRQLDAEIKKAQAEIEQVRCDGEKIGLSLRLGKSEHFAGPGSGVFNDKLQVKRQKMHTLRLKKENLLNKQDPTRAQSIHANKVAYKLQVRSHQAFWGTLCGDLALLQKSDAPVKVGADVEVVTRMSVGLILASPSPVRCYHVVNGRTIRCDCIQDAPRKWFLSDRACKLQAVGKLVLDDSTQRYQEVLIESGCSADVRFGLGGMGGAVTRALLEKANESWQQQ